MSHGLIPVWIIRRRGSSESTSTVQTLAIVPFEPDARSICVKLEELYRCKLELKQVWWKLRPSAIRTFFND